MLKDTGSAGGSRPWPLKIELVPENAPFLQGEVVIAADCAGFASPDIQGVLGDRPVLIGCSKLKDRSAYLDKLESIFRSSDLDSVELVLMEVPCCSGMHSLVLEALERADEDLPLSKVIIGIDGGCRHGR